jgi:hypothetical protein
MKLNALIALIIALNLPRLLLTQTPQMLLPDGNGAWLVQVVTFGGILGKGDLDFAVSSEGKMSCSFQVRCPTDFKAADFHPLVGTIRDVVFPARPSPAISLCNDCITRRITISRRDSMGIVQTYTGSWDETTRDQVPQEVIRIYDAFRALMK